MGSGWNSSNNNNVNNTRMKLNTNSVKAMLRRNMRFNNIHRIAKGQQSVVYSLDNNGIIKVAVGDSLEDLEREMRISDLMSENGIGPQVHKSFIANWKNENYLVLHMEKMDGTLAQLKIKEKGMRRELIENIQTMLNNSINEYRICHRDIHIENVMYKLTGGSMKVLLIDFGMSEENIASENCHQHMDFISKLKQMKPPRGKVRNNSPPRRGLFGNNSPPRRGLFANKSPPTRGLFANNSPPRVKQINWGYETP